MPSKRTRPGDDDNDSEVEIVSTSFDIPRPGSVSASNTKPQPHSQRPRARRGARPSLNLAASDAHPFSYPTMPVPQNKAVMGAVQSSSAHTRATPAGPSIAAADSH